jgi:hypothetical protein
MRVEQHIESALCRSLKPLPKNSLRSLQRRMALDFSMNFTSLGHITSQSDIGVHIEFKLKAICFYTKRLTLTGKLRCLIDLCELGQWSKSCGVHVTELVFQSDVFQPSDDATICA